MYPKDFRYTKDHEWIKVEGNTGIVGITDYAQKQLGDIVYVELPEIDDEFSKGDEVATVESVKAASPIFIPVSGKIVEINEELEDSPELVNQDPHGKGWIFKVELSDESELEELLTAEAYEELIKAEGE
ncbi:glycine cleavage system H protein [Thermotomaculum hydrothermale]|uniref:Glycine cleavage system H protein n=1 Tax=Thermotomaculum hydrothermale TaxID=981385 RepID=A0A7R6SYN8_9BACT|nr:glycine cleavage system protein GcvH [Thermotomaculum hydrothermale]BBB31922.1 glycine cleavage system H protein [Thermotomaculum hydrothermale]